jgi:hypothetical protein
MVLRGLHDKAVEHASFRHSSRAGEFFFFLYFFLLRCTTTRNKEVYEACTATTAHMAPHKQRSALLGLVERKVFPSTNRRLASRVGRNRCYTRQVPSWQRQQTLFAKPYPSRHRAFLLDPTVGQIAVMTWLGWG